MFRSLFLWIPICAISLIGFNTVSTKEEPSQAYTKGTLIIIAGCVDGILIASDSRLTSFSKGENGRYYAESFRDGCKKIYLVNGIPMAYAGQNDFGSTRLDSIISNYNLHVGEMSEYDFLDKIDSFVTYMGIQFSVSKYPIMSKSQFFTAGYKNGVSLIGRFMYTSDSVVFSQFEDTIHFSQDGVDKIFNKYIFGSTRSLPCSKVIPVLEKTIKEFSKTNYTVGGEVSIIKINKDNSHSCELNCFESPFCKEQKKLIPYSDTARWNRAIKGILN